MKAGDLRVGMWVQRIYGRRIPVSTRMAQPPRPVRVLSTQLQTLNGRHCGVLVQHEGGSTELIAIHRLEPIDRADTAVTITVDWIDFAPGRAQGVWRFPIAHDAYAGRRKRQRRAPRQRRRLQQLSLFG